MEAVSPSSLMISPTSLEWPTRTSHVVGDDEGSGDLEDEAVVGFLFVFVHGRWCWLVEGERREGVNFLWKWLNGVE